MECMCCLFFSREPLVLERTVHGITFDMHKICTFLRKRYSLSFSIEKVVESELKRNPYFLSDTSPIDAKKTDVILASMPDGILIVQGSNYVRAMYNQYKRCNGCPMILVKWIYIYEVEKFVIPDEKHTKETVIDQTPTIECSDDNEESSLL